MTAGAIADPAPIDPSAYADGLVPAGPGLWRAADGPRVSYPASGHTTLFAIEDASWWFRHRNACIVAAMRRLPPAGPVADLGGGNGVVTAALAAAGIGAFLVEPGAEGVRNAGLRGVTPIVRATFEAAGFRPGALPAAGLFDVLEHVEDDVAFLRAIATALAPGGRLYCTVPAHGALWSAEDDAAGHRRRYATRTLRSALAAGGFMLEQLTPLFWFLPLPVLVARTLASRHGLRPDGPAASRRGEYVLRGPADRAVRAALGPERALVARGRGFPGGTSLLAVARRA